MKKVKLSKNLAKQLEKDLEQAFFRYTKEKGLNFGRKFWEAVFNSDKDILDIGKTVVTKLIPNKTEHSGEIQGGSKQVVIIRQETKKGDNVRVEDKA